MIQLNVELYLTELTDENESEVKKKMFELFEPGRMVRIIVDGKLSDVCRLDEIFNA